MLTVKTPKLHTLKLKLSLTSNTTIFLVCSLFLNSTLHSSCFTQTKVVIFQIRQPQLDEASRYFGVWISGVFLIVSRWWEILYLN